MNTKGIRRSCRSSRATRALHLHHQVRSRGPSITRVTRANSTARTGRVSVVTDRADHLLVSSACERASRAPTSAAGICGTPVTDGHRRRAKAFVPISCTFRHLHLDEPATGHYLRMTPPEQSRSQGWRTTARVAHAHFFQRRTWSLRTDLRVVDLAPPGAPEVVLPGGPSLQLPQPSAQPRARSRRPQSRVLHFLPVRPGVSAKVLVGR